MPDENLDPVGEWVVCLGCQATRPPYEPDRQCACFNGYPAEPGTGILDSDYAFEWYRASQLDPGERRLIFPQLA